VRAFCGDCTPADDITAVVIKAVGEAPAGDRARPAKEPRAEAGTGFTEKLRQRLRSITPGPGGGSKDGGEA
jgi:hypothetical protein